MNYQALVRRLLRSVHRPHELERDAFGIALMRAAGGSSVRGTLITAIAQAFPDGEADRLHRTILQRYDIEQPVPRYRAAAEMALSPRRFYYLHAEAVEILARQVARMMRRHNPETPAEQLADLLLENDPAAAAVMIGGGAKHGDAQTALQLLYAHLVSRPLGAPAPSDAYAFKNTDAAVAAALRALWLENRGCRDEALAELQKAQSARCDHLGNPSHFAQLAILNARAAMARHDGDAETLTGIARTARTCGVELPRGFEPWHSLLAIDAALASGEPEHAAESIDEALAAAMASGAYRFACLLGLCHARALMLKGEFAAASDAARAVAACAKSHADIASAAYIIGARVALAVDAPTGSGAVAPHSLWDDLHVRALRARSRLSGAGAEDTIEQAELVRDEASGLGYRALAAHAAGTIALAQNDEGAAVAAWRTWLVGRDALQGFDVVAPMRAHALLSEAAALGALHELACRDHPEWPVLRFLNEQNAERFWNALPAAALDNLPAEALAPLVNALLASPSRPSLHALPLPDGANTAKHFAAAVSFLLPFQDRAAFVRSLSAHLAYCNARARRAIERERARAALELSG